MSEDNPISTALKDEKIIKLRNKAKLQKFDIDPTLLKEIKTYIIFADASRKPFEPNSANDLKQLISEMEKTQAFRDRLTMIIIESKSLIDDLDILIKSGTAYIFTRYGNQIKSLSNKESRDNAVRHIMDTVIRKRDQWISIRETAELAMTNLNNTYFSLREIGENGRRILDARNVKRSFDV